MGIQLVGEVLDHYRGPDHKFRWLAAFAYSAKDRTRTGWPGRDVLAHRTQKSAARTSHIAAELVADGVLERAGGGGKHRGNARYTLLPLAPQGAPRANPDEISGCAQDALSGCAQDALQGARPRRQPAQTSYGSHGVREESSRLTELAIAEVRRHTGQTITAETAERGLKAKMDGRDIASPAAWLRKVIASDPGWWLPSPQPRRFRNGRFEP